jgi:hypothetical protein
MSLPDQQFPQRHAPAVWFGVSELFWRRRQPQRIVTAEAGTGALHENAVVAAFSGAFMGCLTTLCLSACGFVPAIASALAAVLLCGLVLATRTTSLLTGEVFTAIFGGTFAGMTPVLRLVDDASGGPSACAWFILLSIVCGLAFGVVAAIDARSGRRLAGSCGGRSGTIAAVASLLFMELAPLFGADGPLLRVARADTPDAGPMAAALTGAVCMIGMFASLIVLRQRSVASVTAAHRILIAAVVALLGLIALDMSAPDDTRLLDAFYAGCFLGMSTPKRLKGWIEPCFAAILLTAMLVLVRALLPGVGGGLGFAALVTLAVLAVLRRMTAWLIDHVFARNRHPRSASEPSASGRAGASTWVLRRRTIAFAGFVLALLAIGCFLGPSQVAMEEPAVSASVEATPATAPVEVASADLRAELPPEPNVAAVQNELSPRGAADAQTELGNAGRKDAVSMASAEVPQSAIPIDDTPKSGEELYREFLRWRTAQLDERSQPAISQPAPQPIKRSHNRALPNTGPDRKTRNGAGYAP